MYDQFEVISFLRQTLAVSQNGRVYIQCEDTEWCLDIIDGQVLFAAHSLQYLTTLETVLPSLGYGAALPAYWRLTQSLYKHQGDIHGLEALSWTSKIVGALVQQNALTLQQAEKVLVKLTEDAVESLLGLDAATVTWYPMPQDLWYVTANGKPISALLQYLAGRLRAWQSVCDRIYSPFQRPYCENPNDLYQSVPQGLLSQQMLEALARLMQGATLRQLAQSVKQDEAKLAKLLYPYIQHRVIKLWPPVQPLDRLPWLPGAKLPTENLSMAPAPATFKPTTQQPVNGERFTDSYSVTPLNNQVTNKFPSIARRTHNQLSVTNKLDTHNGLSSPQGVTKTHVRSNQFDSRTLARASSSAIPPPPSVSETRYLIVCIDDSQAMLEQIDSYLDPELFNLKTIIDPVASVSKICAMKPDLVLMDVSMPSINGNSLCQILKRSYMFKDVPIIMISSNASPLNKATAQSSGATDYLEKPFSKAQLMKILETYLEPSSSFS